MQSDERIAAVLTALGSRIAQFRFAISATLERARNTLASESGPDQARSLLGEFGNRLIDPSRFAMVSSGAGPLDAAAHAAVERAAAALEALLQEGGERFVLEVESGASLSKAVRERLATLGSVFGAAVTIERVRQRTYDPGEEQRMIGHPFELWSAGDRKLAPPLVVRIDGSDLDAIALAPFVDGWVRFVFLVNGSSTAAPLAPLVSPGVFVAQADDIKVLERIKEFEGPAVIAVMSGGEARFVHDPRAGAATWQRLNVGRIPTLQPRKSLPVRSAWQQRDDLARLKSLAEQPVYSTEPGALAAAVAGNGSDPTDRLTAWLLDQSGLGDSPEGVS